MAEVSIWVECELCDKHFDPDDDRMGCLSSDYGLHQPDSSGYEDEPWTGSCHSGGD